MNLKSLLPVLLTSLLLLAGCTAGTPSESAAEPTAESIGTAENPFSVSGANYSFDGTKITAAACAPSNFDQVFSGAFYEDSLLEGDFAAEVELTLDTIYSSGGLLFRASSSEEYDGFEGYALMLRDRKLYLYEAGGSKASGMMFREIAHRSIEDYKRGSTLRLRAERIGNTFRLYYLDDAAWNRGRNSNMS